jgi:hypothetical protein
MAEQYEHVYAQLHRRTGLAETEAASALSGVLM